MEMKVAEESHKDPTEKAIINEKNWQHTLDDVEEYLRICLGQTHIPLSYVLRKDEQVPPHIVDPTNNCTSIQDEMINRAPQVNVNGEKTLLFTTDDKRVWTLIHELTRNHKCYTYIKGFARVQDGRAAFLALHNHYLGINNVNRLSPGQWCRAHVAHSSIPKRKQTLQF
jgi:hypothetical protein